MALVLYKGVAWRRRITVTREDTGDAVDLTGLDVALNIKRRSGEAALISLAVGTGITLLAQSGATVGMADVEVPADDSVGLEVAAHVFVVLVDDQIALPPTKLPVRAV